jgi:hypothetical protein
LKRIGDYLLIGAVVLWVACSESESVKLPKSEEYFPMQVGRYWVYDVTQTAYSEVEPKMVISVFELKSEVIGAFENLNGGLTFVIHNSQRANAMQQWEYVDTWSARSDEFKAVITENDVPYIQLKFPLYKNKSWDGNELNTGDADEYVVESVGTIFTKSNNEPIDDCVVVNEESYIDFTYKDERKEIYARNIGLVFKKKIQLEYCVDTNCFGEQIIKRGEEWIQELKSYGQN